MHRRGKRLKHVLRRAARLGTVFALIIMSVLPQVKASAAAAALPSFDETDAYAQDIIKHETEKNGAKDVQSLLDGVMTENAAGMYDWFALALMQSGEKLDFSSYANALKNNAAEKNANAVEKERFALILSAFDGNEEYIRGVSDSCAGKLGVMSDIFALNIANNISAETAENDRLVNELLSVQTANGGWCLNGENASADETAMAIQALAPYYNENAQVSAAVDKALDALSSMQTDNGGFISYGNENAESCAQVIIALCSLGISPAEDVRFIKNGNSVFDALMSFRLENGAFEHVKSKGENFKATEQALLAFTAMKRFSSGASPLFILDKQAAVPTKTDTKLPVYVIFGCAALLFLILTVVLAKKKNKLSYLFLILLIATLVAGFFFCSDIQKPEDYYTVTEAAAGENAVTASISISCETVKEYSSENEAVPADGVILPTTEITLPKGSTVYDFLIYAAKKYGIHTENDSATAASAYISGINRLYEFDYGELSGWVFLVNGKIADVGCGEYVITDGDNIEWLYTRTLGEDLTE